MTTKRNILLCLFFIVSSLVFNSLSAQIFPDQSHFKVRTILKQSDLLNHTGFFQKAIALDSHRVVVGCYCQLKNGIENIFTYDRKTKQFDQMGNNPPAPSRFFTQLDTSWYVVDSSNKKLYYYEPSLANWTLWKTSTNLITIVPFRDSLLLVFESNVVKIYNESRVLVQQMTIPTSYVSANGFIAFAQNNESVFFAQQPGPEIHQLKIESDTFTYSLIPTLNGTTFGLLRTLYATDTSIYVTGSLGTLTSYEYLYEYNFNNNSWGNSPIATLDALFFVPGFNIEGSFRDSLLLFSTPLIGVRLLNTLPSTYIYGMGAFNPRTNEYTTVLDDFMGVSPSAAVDSDYSIWFGARDLAGATNYATLGGHQSDSIFLGLAVYEKIIPTDLTFCPNDTAPVINFVADTTVSYFGYDSFHVANIVYYDSLKTTPMISYDNGTSSGIILQSISGGTAPYNYLWNDGTTGQDLLLVTAGVYQLNVTDAVGCQDSFYYSIGIINTTDTTLCFGETFMNYTASGTYIDTTFINGYDSINILNLMVSDEISVTATISGDAGNATGSILLTKPITANYTFLWSNNVTTQHNENIDAGDYSVTVTDENGCSNIYNFTVPSIVNTRNVDLDKYWSIFPNPIPHNQTRLTLSHKGNATEMIDIQLFNGNGAIVSNDKKAISANGQLELDFGSLTGFYILKVINQQGETWTIKLIFY